MIGQKDLLDKLDTQYNKGVFPRFAIFVGANGSGKRTLMREFAHKHWEYVYELPDVKTDTLRQMIAAVYTITSPTIYIIPDAHKMSVNAKNTLLKITEEPPNKATFLMSSTSPDNVLDTIRSRGTMFYMRPYSADDMSKYIHSRGSDLEASDFDFIVQVCNNMSDVEKCLKIDIKAFYEYVAKIVDKIGKVTLANAMKTSQALAMKDEEDKYDLELFWRTVIIQCAILSKSTDDMRLRKLYKDIIFETESRIMDITKTSIDKRNTYDMWLLNVRELNDGYKSSQSTD